MRWVLKGQTALKIVLEEVHLSTDVAVLENLLLLVVPTQLGMGVAPNCKLDAGIMALLRFSQSQDHWRNCRKKVKKPGPLHDS